MRRLTSPILTLILLLLASTAGAGVLRTRDGRIFEGDLTFEPDGSMKVTPKVAGGFALSFPLSDVAAMTLRPPLTGVFSGGSLAGGWAVQDIGATSVAGRTDYAAGEFTLRGEGAQFGSSTDDFHFVYHRLPSDGQLVAHVQSLSAKDSDLTDIHPSAKAGLMIRKTLDPASCFCGLVLTVDEGPKLFVRPNSDSAAVIIPVVSPAKIKPPYWLQLTRVHNQISTAISPDGKKWELIAQQPMEVLQEAYVGMFVSSNRADQLATAVFDQVRVTIHGLEAQYFADTKFKDLRLTRIDPKIDFNWAGHAPDPAIPENNFSVRWTGQLLAPSTDQYYFSIAADTAARLYINNQMVLDTRSRVPRSGNVNLLMDKRYDLRVDYYEGVGNPSCRLYWSCTSQPELQIIPTEQFFYTPPVGVANPPADPALPSQPFTVARGVLLTDGSFLPGSAKSADAKSLAFLYRDRNELAIPLEKVAWLVCHPLTPEALAKIPAKGTGLLTIAGDFVDGDCQEIAGGKAKLSSVVFGVSAFDTATQAAAILYHSTGSSAALWTIRTTSGGVIRAAKFRVDQKKLIIDEPMLGEFEMRLGEVAEIILAEAGR
jgi:regulation of enolase protein 1 (concanavalin A-like superfamily)